jgi:phosphoribosylformylglycinamidine synthase
MRAELLLFHEGPSRILLSTAKPENVLEVARKNRVEAAPIGVTMKERLRIDCGSETVLDCDLADLREPWETSLEQMLHQS